MNRSNSPTTNLVTRIYNYLAPILGLLGLTIIIFVLFWGLFGNVLNHLAHFTGGK